MTLSAGGRKIADVAPPLVVGVLFLAGWEACCRTFGVPSYLVPSPSLIATTLVADAPSLLHALWVTLRVTLIVAIAPLIIILVKNTQGALIICATIIAIFPIISNTTVGLRTVDAGHRDLFAINRASLL